MRLRFAGRESLKLVRFNAEAQGGGPAFQNADSDFILRKAGMWIPGALKIYDNIY